MTELNFEKYVASAFYTSNNSLVDQVNITNRSINTTALTLVKDNSYNFSMIAHYLAGNVRSSANTSIQTIYFVDPVCGTLVQGWNACGAV